MRRITMPALFVLLAALLSAAALADNSPDACSLVSPEVVKQYLGLDVSMVRQGRPPGPGGASSCELDGATVNITLGGVTTQDHDSVTVQIWTGPAAKSLYHPELLGPGVAQFAAGDLKGYVTEAHMRNFSQGGVRILTGEMLVDVLANGYQTQFSAVQFKAFRDYLIGKL